MLICEKTQIELKAGLQKWVNDTTEMLKYNNIKDGRLALRNILILIREKKLNRKYILSLIPFDLLKKTGGLLK